MEGDRENKQKLRDSDSAPFVVDISPRHSGETLEEGLTGKVGKSITILSGRDGGRKKRRKMMDCGGGSKCCCVMVVIVLLIIAQFAWSLSLQFSVVRLLTKLEAVEKLADTALDLTTNVATAAAQTAAQAAAAANRAIDAVVSTGLGRVQNLTNGDTLLAGVIAAKQQAEAAAASAKDYAQTAATAKDMAIAAARLSREKAGEVVTDFEEAFRKFWEASSQQAKSLGGQAWVLNDPSGGVGGEGAPLEAGRGRVEHTSGQRTEDVEMAETLSSEDHPDVVAVNKNEAANGEGDDVREWEESGGGRRRRGVEEEDEMDTRGARHSGRAQSGRPKKTPSLHLKMKINASDNQRMYLSNDEETYIALDYGQLYRESYSPRPDGRADCTGCHVYREWEVAYVDPTGSLAYQAETGRIRVTKNGLYHLYGQIYYKNTASRSGFKMVVGRRQRHRGILRERQNEEEIALCLTSVSSFPPFINCTERTVEGACGSKVMTLDQLRMVELMQSLYSEQKIYAEHKTCYTSTTVYLYREDTVHLTDVYSTRIASEPAHANFFGIFKVSDA